MSSHAASSKIIGVTLVDDDSLIVGLLADFLATIPGIEVLAVYNSGNSFLMDLSTSNVPNILLLDLKMQDGSGIEVLDAIARDFSGIKTIVLSSHYQPNYLGHMFRLGANAFLPKEIGKEELVNIIHEVSRRGHYFDSDQIEVLRTQTSDRISSFRIDHSDVLSKREIDVLRLLCHQMSAQEIGDKLFISKRTVETHKSSLLSKTGAKNVAGLIIFAAQNKLVDLEGIRL